LEVLTRIALTLAGKMIKSSETGYDAYGLFSWAVILPRRGDMAVIPKDPLDWLIFFRQQINELFNDLSAIEVKETNGEHEYLPLVDIFETAENFVVEIELPGFANEDISLSICCNMLVVEGIKRQEPRSAGVNFICLERLYGRFCRAVEIPPAVDMSRVAAKYAKGVLAIGFPKVRDKSIIIRNIPIEQGD
ncbi:MAG TPA: Hsp20/alpha crystallin family protein, partial [Geobacteraceae bacterium]|nr:Hsp20/alpha crystallin family protein [Geobacteraceae bacterium]